MYGLHLQPITAASVLLGGLLSVSFLLKVLQTAAVADEKKHQLALYVIARCAYMLLLHPLAKYPGPRLAAVSDVRTLDHPRASDTLMLGQ